MEIAALAPLLAWGVLVGIVFSAIGAAGGILTSFGLITLFGVADPNSVKPMTQLIVLATALVFVPNYVRRSSLVVPLGLLLGAGGLAGAWTGSTLSTLYLADMKTFRPLFGLLTLAIAGQIAWKLYRGRHGGPSAPEAPPGVGGMEFSLRSLDFRCCATDFRVPLWSPLLAGALIAMTASVFGVGGGFLLVPYMTSVLGLPMHVVPGTAAIAIFMALVVSIGNFVALGAPLQMDLLLPLGLGAVVGAVLGPRVNRRLNNDLLLAAMAVIVAGIGVKYTLF